MAKLSKERQVLQKALVKMFSQYQRHLQAFRKVAKGGADEEDRARVQAMIMVMHPVGAVWKAAQALNKAAQDDPKAVKAGVKAIIPLIHPVGVCLQALQVLKREAEKKPDVVSKAYLATLTHPVGLLLQALKALRKSVEKAIYRKRKIWTPLRKKGRSKVSIELETISKRSQSKVRPPRGST